MRIRPVFGIGGAVLVVFVLFTVCAQPQSPATGAAAAPVLPATPADLTVSSPAKVTTVTLTWSSVAGASGYHVYRSASQNGVYAPVGGVVPLATTAFQDTLLFPGTIYWYKVTAYNANGESAASAAVSAETAAVVPISVTTLTGPLVTWEAGNVYWVKSTVHLTAGKVLSVEPGVIVKFAAGTQLIIDTGALMTVSGLEAAPVVFTSVPDDSVGGCTDGVPLIPAKGNWSGVVAAGDFSSVGFAAFRYATTGLTVTGASCSVRNGVFTDNTNGLDADAVGAGFSVTQSAFYRNNYPLLINGTFSVDDTLSFHNPSHTSETNLYQGIWIMLSNANISANVTWSCTGAPFVYNNFSSVNNQIIVASPNTLTLAPGVSVKMATDCRLTVSAGASLNAVGTVARPIVFTSSNDSSAGGDSTGGSPTAPAPSAWYGVTTAGDSSAFERCEFRYAAVGLTVTAAQVRVKDSLFRGNTTGLLAEAVGSGFSLSGTTFFGNTWPLFIGGTYDVDDSLSFVDPASPSTGNTYQAIRIRLSTFEIRKNVTWSATSVPFVYDNNSSVNNKIWVTSPNTLSLGPGTVVKFASGSTLHVNLGASLRVNGTAEQPVVLTSSWDGTALGDSTGGSATGPNPGDWVGVYLQGAASVFDHADVRYASRGLEVLAANVAVRSCLLRDCLTGLVAQDSSVGSGFVLSESTFYGNDYPLVIGRGYPVDDTLSFENPASPSVKNVHQAIYIKQSSFTVNSLTSWTNTKVAYVFDNFSTVNNMAYVSAGGTLTLGSGTVLKFRPGAGLTVQTGGSLMGFAGAVFTSQKDDAVLGDSNGDASATSPAAGDWVGISQGTWLTGANVRYAQH